MRKINLRRHARHFFAGVLAAMASTLLVCLSAAPASAQGVVGGFSSGSWNGSTSWSSYYNYGIVQAGGMTSSSDCSYPQDENTNFTGAASALNNAGLPVSAFLFLTSNYFSTTVCGNSTSPMQWGEIQGSLFATILGNYNGPLTRVLADVETGLGADWTLDTQANNQQVIDGFNYELCNAFSYCSDGVYSNISDWQTIIGSNVAPYLDTSHFWLASWGPNQSQLNSQEDYFTTSPGGYSIFSWQYATSACQISYSSAQTEASNASPQIPQFDKWTNTNPALVC